MRPCVFGCARRAAVAALLFACSIPATRAGTFRVAAYNVENYLDAPTKTRHAKSEASKAKAREIILAIHPDVLALEEMGTASALDELRGSLKTGGLDFPYWTQVSGHDPDIHLAVLSRFPFTRVEPHTNDDFLLDGRRFLVSRGFAQVQVRVSPAYEFTLLSAHLKSKRPVPEADEADLRLEEAKVLREKIDSVLKQDSDANLIVLGDLNDNRNSPPLRAILGRGKAKLIDTRPAERNGDSLPAGTSRSNGRNVAWTDYYAVEDTYSRLDYILLSAGMAREWAREDTFVYSTANWGVASDHRPVVATFSDTDQ